MGLRGPFPESFLSKIVNPEQPAIEQPAKLGPPVPSEQPVKSERELHSEFSAFLKREGFCLVVHADPRKRSRIRPGWPDYTIFRGSKWLAIEFKIPPNKLTEQQAFMINLILQQGGTTAVCYTLEQAKNLTRKFFSL